MRSTFPVLWALHGVLLTGRLDIEDDRLTLTSRTRSFSFPLASIADRTLERGSARRIRGLPALTLGLHGGEQVRIASLGGAGSLQEISILLGCPRISAPAAAPVLRSSSPTPA